MRLEDVRRDTAEMNVLEKIREAIRALNYDMTKHALDEMVDDHLTRVDVESAVLAGTITKTTKSDLRGTKYTVVGLATDQETVVGVVGRFTETGRYLIITVYEVGER